MRGGGLCLGTNKTARGDVNLLERPAGDEAVKRTPGKHSRSYATPDGLELSLHRDLKSSAIFESVSYFP